MTAISPRVASELAEAAYQTHAVSKNGAFRLKLDPEIEHFFDFDFSDGPVRGRSGGFFGLYRKTTGFAMVGHGKGRYQGHHVIAMRGTRSLYDGLTSANFGMATTHDGSTIHAGFNSTFSSMKPRLEQQLTPRLRTFGGGTVHCVGHSLGGALASITAGWVKARYGGPVNLYTFGAPRVGLEGYANNSTFAVDQHYRCTHGGDPVPKVPLWPFEHAPNSGGGEYRLDQGQGISFPAHGMGQDATPGYRNTAGGNDWDKLQRRSLNYLKPVRLHYERRHQASFTGYWADQINAAVVTLLNDAGYYTAVAAQAVIGTSLTFYDMVARTLEQIAKASDGFAGQVKGLLGHMLVFAGKVGVKVADLSFQFIRWVFDQALGRLYRSVKQALDGI